MHTKLALSSCSLYSYADDSQMLLTYPPPGVHEAVQCFNADLRRVKEWSEGHGLKLNADKCSVVHFCSPSIKETMNRSILSVSVEVFGSCLTQEANVILARIQNSALRFVYNLKKFDHISPYRKRANLHSVQDICRLQTVTLVHKVLVTGEPSYLRRKLVARATLRERHTRQDDKLQLPRVRLEATKRSFSYFGPQEYNALPPVIKTLSVKTFKKEVKTVYVP
ncbi:hypothetical protein J6590_083653 [Homalodisca vitripennis]|nr:hypothetical protein J6590_083653 [Homalodisca vitripennis]